MNRKPFELRALARLVDPAPWEPPSYDASRREDRSLRSAYRRWNPAQSAPPVELLAPIYDVLTEAEERYAKEGWEPLIPADASARAPERIAHRAAVVLHLLAQLPERAEARMTTHNFGDACRKAGIANARFARLVSPPTNEARRVAALSRVFRQLRSEGIVLRVVDPTGVRPNRDELARLHAFLFGTPRHAVSGWARGYFWSPKPKAAESADLSN